MAVALTLKLTSDISKKILPAPSTLIRPCVVVTFGIVTVSVPSFGVLARIVVGNVRPPSVENDILTFAALTGAAVVLFTVHEMVCDEPPAHVTAVLGAVTLKGPELPSTLTEAVAVFIPPPASIHRSNSLRTGRNRASKAVH